MAERTIKGRIVFVGDPKAPTPLANVPVMLVRLAGRSEPRVDLTDKDGKFEFTVGSDTKQAMCFPASHVDSTGAMDLLTSSVLFETDIGDEVVLEYGPRAPAATIPDHVLIGTIANAIENGATDIQSAVDHRAIDAITNGLGPPTTSVKLVAAVEHVANEKVLNEIGPTAGDLQQAVEELAKSAVEAELTAGTATTIKTAVTTAVDADLAIAGSGLRGRVGRLIQDAVGEIDLVDPVRVDRT